MARGQAASLCRQPRSKIWTVLACSRRADGQQPMGSSREQTMPCRRHACPCTLTKGARRSLALASARLHEAPGPCLLHAGRSSDGTDVALRSTADARFNAVACSIVHCRSLTESSGLYRDSQGPHT